MEEIARSSNNDRLYYIFTETRNVHARMRCFSSSLSHQLKLFDLKPPRHH